MVAEPAEPVVLAAVPLISISNVWVVSTSPGSTTSEINEACLTIDHAGPEASVTEAIITSFTLSGTKVSFLIATLLLDTCIGSITVIVSSSVIVSIV